MTALEIIMLCVTPVSIALNIFYMIMASWWAKTVRRAKEDAEAVRNSYMQLLAGISTTLYSNQKTPDDGRKDNIGTEDTDRQREKIVED